jgi:CheY-like chemotaxis protein
MYNTHWKVLIVDDEPDVLAVSKLVMKKFRAYDLPLQLFTANSKAEAVDLLESRLTQASTSTNGLALAMIDVVMESDQSGLELCNYIRNDLHNRTSQIFIRTGQPGTAPERAVIDRYDINGYLTKVESDDEKLFSIIKAGIRQYLFTSFSSGVLNNLSELVQNCSTRDGMKTAIGNLWGRQTGTVTFDNDGNRLGGYTWIGDQAIDCGLGDELAAQTREKLETRTGVNIDAGGHYTLGDDNQFSITIAPTSKHSGLTHIVHSGFTPPIHIVKLMRQNLAAIATLWARADE